MTDVILETRNLKKSFGKLGVLKGISTGIRRGEVVSMKMRLYPSSAPPAAESPPFSGV